MLFEGGGLALHPKGGVGGLGAYNSLLLCSSAVAPGADCFGAAEPAVRYDSPTWGGFRFETSYGTADVVPSILNSDASQTLNPALFIHPNTSDSNFWDIAAFYNKDWGNFKVSLAYAYTYLESNPLNGGVESYHQAGGTLMHVPSGLGIYATGNWEDVGGASNNCPGALGNACLSQATGAALPDTNSWGLKPFIKRTWNPLGATVLYGEYYQYNDMYGLGNIQGIASAIPACPGGNCTIYNSQVERWGLGAVQEIDSAAMHVFARWQHMNVTEFDFVNNNNGTRHSQGFDNNDLFQLGGIIFF